MVHHASRKPVLKKKYSEAEEGKLRFLRLFGLFASFCSLGFTCVAIGNKRWVVWADTEYSNGIWENCGYVLNGHESNTTTESCVEKLTNCHWAVIVLMFLSIAFGLLATTLATVGVCVTSLSWKLYYFHSAGEIYFVCTLFTLTAIAIRSACLELNQEQRRKNSRERRVEEFHQLIMKRQIMQVYERDGQFEPYYINPEKDLLQLYHPILVQDLDPWNLTIPYRDWPQAYNIGPGIYIALVSALFYLMAAMAMSADDLVLFVRKWIIRRRKVANLKRNKKFEGQMREDVAVREPASQIPSSFL